MSEQPHHRIDLAVEQLDVALELFLNGRSYVAALTLAGAAEEILGKALSLEGKENAMRYKYDAMAPVQLALHRKPLEWKQFAESENRARNAAKHMNSLAESTVNIDVQDAALWMLVRACANYDRLDFPRTDRMRDFDNWFYEHVVGV